MSYLDAIAELLDVAGSSLREKVQPAVAGELRYEVAMIANAIAIAARAVELGPVHREREARLLADFYGDGTSDQSNLRRRLARDLRTGAIGPEREPALRELLEALVADRLSISRPDG